MFVYVFVTVLFDYVAPFAIGFLLSVLLEPAVDWLNRKLKIDRGILGLFCILLMIFLFAFAGTRIFARLLEESKAFSVRLALNQLQENYANLLDLIPEEFQPVADSVAPAAISSAATAVSDFVKKFSTSLVRTVPGIFIGTILCFISLFFFIKDRPKIIALFLKNSHPLALPLASPSLISSYQTMKKSWLGALGGYIRAQCILMSISATICILGLSFINYPFALLVSLLIALVDALPVFGSGFILWPWALSCLISGDFNRAITLMIIYAVIFITRQTLEPKILGSQIGVHPLVTLMAMFIGLKVFGPLGFLIGPFVVITIKTLPVR